MTTSKKSMRSALKTVFDGPKKVKKNQITIDGSSVKKSTKSPVNKPKTDTQDYLRERLLKYKKNHEGSLQGFGNKEGSTNSKLLAGNSVDAAARKLEANNAAKNVKSDSKELKGNNWWVKPVKKGMAKSEFTMDSKDKSFKSLKRKSKGGGF